MSGRKLITLAAAALVVSGPAFGIPVVGPTGTFETGRMSAAPDPSGPVAAELRAMLEDAESGPLALTADEASAMATFYAARSWRPVWTEDGLVSAPGAAAIRRLARAAEDGLDPAAYATPSLDLGRNWPVMASAVAEAELLVARSVMRYATHARAGRLAPGDVAGLITLRPERPDGAQVLAAVSGASDPGAALAAYNPPHAGYKRLRAKLAELRSGRGAAEAGAIFVPGGTLLKVGVRDRRVALLRRRLATEPPGGDADLFDADLEAAVIEFQSSAGLATDGIVGKSTLAALNSGAPPATIAGILANMEFWRWMPRDLGAFHVFVNIPEFRLRIFRDGEEVHGARIVVGKVTNKTPVFSDEMEHVVVNPYWNVPASIVRNEMLPGIRANPVGYLASRGYEVLYGGRRIHPASVRWDAGAARQVRIRQRPGAGNALGKVKFLFPNRHAVYLHDTPSRHLFERPVRTFSHGCIRVENPLEFADILLSGDEKVSGARIRALIGQKEQWVNLTRHIPVHISYFTTWVDTSGALQAVHDVYGYEKKVRTLLGL